MDVKKKLKAVDMVLLAGIKLIEAEKLSMDDDFMKYEPKNKDEEELKELISKAINSGIKNFYCPQCDPAFRNDANGICFVLGKKPAVGKSYNWWYDTAKAYNPERNSRLGTRLQYGAFLGVLIKKLIDEGKTIEWAWNAVSNDSCELGHYMNSKDAKYDFELTGSRMICGFYDLANTEKILAEDEETDAYWLAGGNFNYRGFTKPLAKLGRCNFHYTNHDYSVGWIVLD